jgi:hypothetical protein
MGEIHHNYSVSGQQACGIALAPLLITININKNKHENNEHDSDNFRSRQAHWGREFTWRGNKTT